MGERLPASDGKFQPGDQSGRLVVARRCLPPEFDATAQGAGQPAQDAETQPVAGIVFVLDGVLIGAGDAVYLARAQVLTLKERLYVDRSRALGASQAHLMGRHILPSVSPLILATATLTVPIAILTETTLSFLGLGDPTRASWGKMLQEAQGYLSLAPWMAVVPGVAVAVTVLAFNLLGDALRDRLDPRLR